MKTSLLKISTKIDPIGTRLSVPPKTRQKNPAYKTCQRWPVSIPLRAETADCLFTEKRSMTFVFKTPGTVLTGPLNDMFSSVLSWQLLKKTSLSLWGKVEATSPGYAGQSCQAQDNRTLGILQPWPKSIIFQPRSSLLAKFLRTRCWQQSSSVSLEIFSSLMAYEWVCPKGLEYRQMI